MYVSPTTKEIKKKHSSRPIGGAERGSQAERTQGKAAAGGPSKVADCGGGWAKLQLAGEAAAGGPGDRPHNPGLQHEEKRNKTSKYKTCGGCGSRRHSKPHKRVCWRYPQGPRTYTKPPTWESAPEGPNLLVGSGGSDLELAKS